MKLHFKSVDTNSPFETWLAGFKEIDPSLLIEVDLTSNQFIAKSFPLDKSIVKYSSISIEEMGYELVDICDNDGNKFDWENREKTESGRIKLGIYEVLKNLINVVKMFDGTDHDIFIDFDICRDVMYIGSKKPEPEYQSTTITFKSKTCTMIVKTSRISEFFSKCDDDTFLHRVCNISSPSVYEVNVSALKNLIDISDVLTNVKAKNVIKFYSKSIDGTYGLFAYDETSATYDYLLGYYESGECGATATTIFKDNFLRAIKNGITTDTISITLDTAGSSRIFIDANDSKIVIASTNK